MERRRDREYEGKMIVSAMRLYTCIVKHMRDPNKRKSKGTKRMAKKSIMKRD